MTVGELLVKLLFHPQSAVVVFKGPEYAANIPVEITHVDAQAYVPEGAIASRGECCVIEADPDKWTDEGS